MNAYREREPYKRTPSTWHYYAMYSVERFESFYEFAVNSSDPEPEWYNKGVAELRKSGWHRWLGDQG